MALIQVQLHDGRMGVDRAVPAPWETLTAEQRARWRTVLDHLAAALPPDARSVSVDGTDDRAALLADRLAAHLQDRGRAAVVVDGRGTRRAGHMIVWVRTPPVDGAGHRGEDADAVVDLHDPAWPVLRHLDAHLLPVDSWYRTESRAFFAVRAANWDTKFGADLPAYAAAIAEAALPVGGVAIDLGCGTGRAFPALRSAVGPRGRVLGVDHTPQMLAAAGERARSCDVRLLLADASRLPFAAGTVDVVFAAGLVNHLPDHEAGLAELARVTRPGGRLVLFHPSGRAALAARHGRPLRPDEPLAEAILRASSARTGWQVTSYDDPPHRFHAVAVRTSPA
jgi:SAM-dependent methyltransferase